MGDWGTIDERDERCKYERLDGGWDEVATSARMDEQVINATKCENGEIRDMRVCVFSLDLMDQ